VTPNPGHWKLDVRPRAHRQLARLPEKIATAAAEFITGPLLDNPYRVGGPLRDEYAGQLDHSRSKTHKGRSTLAAQALAYEKRFTVKGSRGL
jgi:mRNA-degrading endonuclease RelE of RelBE toxin-antitoxin system